MITCPNCNSALPDWVQQCQFCKADTSRIPRAVAEKKASYMGQMAPWVWPVYYGISGYLILSGLIDAVRIGMAHQPGISTIFGVSFAVITMVFGLCFILQVDFIRSLGMYFAAINAYFSIVAETTFYGRNMLAASMEKSHILQKAGIKDPRLIAETISRISPWLMSKEVLDLVCSLFLIYLLYETEHSY